MPDFSYYILTDAKQRSPFFGTNLDYQELVGQLCYIGYLRPGERAWMNIVPKKSTRFQSIHTSTVDDYREFDGGDLMEIDTMNTSYHLRRATTNEISETLSRLTKKPITTPIKSSGFYGS